jgi:septal ring factor EnvC (AmiA/AmiB activator)
MRWFIVAAVLVAVSTADASGQTVDERMRAQREELERIRRERDSLQARMRDMTGRVHNLADEVTNLHRQVETTQRLVRSLDQQLASISVEVDSASSNLTRAEAEVLSRRSTLRRRVRDIYKRGPLFATEALLSANSFGELLARYKYLHELALYDRSVVRRVEDLHHRIESQRLLLLRLQDEFARNREEKAREEKRLRDLETQRQRNLAVARRTVQQVQSRLQQIQRDEARLNNVIATLEAERRRALAAGGAGAAALGTSTLKTSDFGKLDWPVEGDIIYRFGRAVNPNNTTIRWNGIGIKAALGTPVKAIADGEVMLAEVIGTYGQSVIIQHGGGDYSVYGSLQRTMVTKGTKVTRGQVIGTVGQADPDVDPHLHLEIRPKGRAMDPLTWLQSRNP